MPEARTTTPQRSLTRHLLVLAALAGLAAPAAAQYGGTGSVAEAMVPEYFTRDIILFVEGMELDETQQVIVEALFDDYEDAFEAGITEMTLKVNSVQENIDELGEDREKILKAVLSPISEWVVTRSDLGMRLLENIEVVLVPRQRDLWPGFMQRLFREKHLKEGRFAGETVDLFHVLRDLDLDPDMVASVQEHLRGYSEQLNEVMRRRHQLLTSMSDNLFQLLSRETGPSIAQIRKLVESRVSVRTVNDEWIEVLVGALPVEQGNAFRHSALERGYPRVYRRTSAQRIIREAADRDDFPPDISQAILVLEKDFLGELSRHNRRLLDRIRTTQPEQEMAKAEAMEVRRQGGAPQKPKNPTRELFKERDEMGRTYVAMLRDLLAPEDFVSLDGSSRWLPREQRAAGADDTRPAAPPNTGGITLQGTPGGGGKGYGYDKDGKPREPQKPRPAGDSGTGGLRGLGSTNDGND